MIITRYNNGHNDFYMENPHTTVEIKKTTRSKTTNQNPLYKIKLHKLPGCFILKAYPPIPTTSSTYMIQQSLIAPLNTL